MIRNLWYAVLESRELKKSILGVMRLGERMVFWRDGTGAAICFYDRCAHRGASLEKGNLCGGTLACPFHGLEYDASGRCVKIPANGKAAPAFFDDLKALDSWGTVVDPWDNHYTKVLENQLDVVHLPFVHHNTIGKGGKTLVEGPGLEWVGETMFCHYPYNKADDGSRPRSPKEVPVPDPTRDYKLECILPNMWENYISQKVRVLGLFVPVDETHTLLYLRFYQNFMRTPGLKQLVLWLAGRFNLIVAHQDRRVVNTQIPKGDGIGKGELLIQGDYPIMEFRKKRIELRKAAERDRTAEPT